LRILLLGAGESGKSTIAKQMKIIHLKGFNTEEKLEFVPIIHANIYESVQSIVKASQFLDIQFTHKQTASIGDLFLQPFSNLLNSELGAKIEEFWKDEGVIRILERRAEFQLLDNTFYFVRHIQRVCEKGYIPTDEDILLSRAATTGVTEMTFIAQGKKFVLVDVGGQRSERKKWIHCFENVTGVLFCVGISAFDQTLYEDHATNRIHEALKLFHEICSSKWFSSTSIILFLNKSDLFKQKLANGKSIAVAFPEFKGGSDYHASIDFLIARFTDVADPVTKKRKEIYTHVTNATDTTGVNVVFDAVRDFLINESLKKSGLM